jgi:monofunctional biosynthetic peptidoglycan transglycosylase
LPNPRRYNSAKPSKYMRKREQDILKIMKNIGRIDFEKSVNSKKKTSAKKR